MSKLLKKQYLSCPQCKTYTRLKKIRIPFGSIRSGVYFPFAVVAALIFDRPSYSGEKCKQCGATENLKKVFLDTEVEKKKEIAFITPAGERIETI